MSAIEQSAPAPLIPIHQYRGADAVSGRELHEYLDVSTEYAKWFARMVEYGFAEGKDFSSLLTKTSTSGRPSTDHALTLDMAKELAMIQRTDRGRRARHYFIEVEKWARHQIQPTQPEVPTDYLTALKHLVASEEARQVAEQRAAEGEAFRNAIESNEGLAPREFHKAYFANVGERAFFELLYSRGLLLDQRGKGTKRDDGTTRDGSQHGHPSYAGKKFFYLDSGVSKKTGYRFEQTRVRPGQPELDLIEYLKHWGLEPTRAESKELAHV